MCGAIPVRRLQLVANVAIRRQRQPLLGHGLGAGVGRDYRKPESFNLGSVFEFADALAYQCVAEAPALVATFDHQTGDPLSPGAGRIVGTKKREPHQLATHVGSVGDPVGPVLGLNHAHGGR